MTEHDRQAVGQELLRNRHWLESSLYTDVFQRAHNLGLVMPGDAGEREEFIKTLAGAFDARLRNLYGGRLWSVTEAGFKAGVAEVRRMLKGRHPGVVGR